MIASGLIVPTERTLRTDDIKRALLTYDRVYLMSPDDRDVIRRQYFLGIVMNFPMDIPYGSVRQLGKVHGYNDAFERTLEQARTAVEQGLLQVIDAPPASQPIANPLNLFHPVPMHGSGPLLSKFVYDIYRRTASDPEFINAISRGMEDLLVGGFGLTDELAPQGLDDFPAAAAYAPAPIPYPGLVALPEARTILDRLCQARLGSTIKSLAVCDARQLSPITSDRGVAAVIAKFSDNVADAVQLAGRSDECFLELLGLRELHNVAITEFVDPNVLASLSVGDVIRMRTPAWGRARESRAQLGEELARMVRDEPDLARLRDRFRRVFEEHARARADWNHEQQKLIVNVLWSLTGSALTSGVLLDGIMSLGTIRAILAVGALSMAWVGPNLPQLMDFLRAQTDIRNLPGYALVGPYTPFLAP